MSESLKVCCEHLANSQHIIEEKSKEIARLTAEVERHRMTEEERVAMDDAAAECDYDNRAMAIRNYLARTAQKESSSG